MSSLLKYFRISISWLFVGLYSTIYIGWDMVHAHVHQEVVVSHSVQVEKDPCHRSVFHGEQDAHKNHFTAFKYCASCHVVSKPPAFNEAIISLHDYSSVSEDTFGFSVCTAQQVISLFSSRAPPSIV